jgi:hypothetical protein
MVYKYEKNIPSEKQCRVEIQIRTKLQHSWATAVEVMGTYLNQPLKQSLGDDEYLDIFKKISKLFIWLEEIGTDYALIKGEVGADYALIKEEVGADYALWSFVLICISTLHCFSDGIFFSYLYTI